MESEIAFLHIENVTVERPSGLGERSIGLRRVSLDLVAGEIFVLTGETGSGKSLLARLIVGVAGPQVKRIAGRIDFEGRDLLAMKPRDLQQIRKGAITMITGDTCGQFNPDRTVRQWLRECLRLSRRSGGIMREKSWGEFFYRVGIVEPERILPKRVGELSQIMARRLGVMKAIIAQSRLLICDDATAGLDRIAEAQFIELLAQVREESKLGILMTTRSLYGVERFADSVAVFYDGGILESGSARKILDDPQYAFTREFRSCDPRITHGSRDLPTISREAAREAETAIHEASSALDGSE